MFYSTVCTFLAIYISVFYSHSDGNILYAEDTLAEKYGKVIYSSLLFRHGERTAANSYPTDPYPLSIWKEGTGQLTKRGKNQAYELGKWFRERYKNTLLREGYRYDLLRAESSDVDRTLMSGELVLAGAYPPTKEEMWSDDDLIWQPIALHTVPSSYDNKIGSSAICDRYQYETQLLNEISKLQNLYMDQLDVFQYVEDHSGEYFNSNDIYSAYDSIWNIYDCLFIQNSHNFTLPKWTKKVFPEPLRTVSSFHFILDVFTTEMKRLRTGPLLNNMIEDMKNKISSPEFNQTIHFYSGHDITIAPFLFSLGIYNSIAPPYSAAVIVELREKDYNYFVTILYRNSSQTPPYLLVPSACGEICTLNKFIEITKPLIPENWQEECQINFSNRLQNLSTSDILVLLFAVATTVIAALVVIRICLERRRKEYNPF
ncbi:hypothetical protein PGB90_003764 [Kerria lacca]